VRQGDDHLVPYRPFGEDSRGVPGNYPVGDQWPDPPAEARAGIEQQVSEEDYGSFSRAIYRWLAHPYFWPRRWRRVR
jgi:hypothetical protein